MISEQQPRRPPADPPREPVDTIGEARDRPTRHGYSRAGARGPSPHGLHQGLQLVPAARSTSPLTAQCHRVALLLLDRAASRRPHMRGRSHCRGGRRGPRRLAQPGHGVVHRRVVAPGEQPADRGVAVERGRVRVALVQQPRTVRASTGAQRCHTIARARRPSRRRRPRHRAPPRAWRWPARSRRRGCRAPCPRARPGRRRSRRRGAASGPRAAAPRRRRRRSPGWPWARRRAPGSASTRPTRCSRSRRAGSPA